MPIIISPEEAAFSLTEYILGDRLIQSSWHMTDEETGQDQACLLGAMHAGINSPQDCPSSLMPTWLSIQLPGAFDNIHGDDDYKEVGAQFAERLIRFGELSPTDWDQIQREVLAAFVRREVNGYSALIAVCTQDGNVDAKRQLLRETFPNDWNSTFDCWGDNDSPPGVIDMYLLQPVGDHTLPELNFDALFEILDRHLPPQPDKVFNFTAETTVITNSSLAVVANNIVRARINAARNAPAGAKLIEHTTLPDFIIQTRDKMGDQPVWHDPEFHFNKVVEWLVANNPAAKALRDNSRLSNTILVIQFLRENYPA